MFISMCIPHIPIVPNSNYQFDLFSKKMGTSNNCSTNGRVVCYIYLDKSRNNVAPNK